MKKLSWIALAAACSCCIFVFTQHREQREALTQCVREIETTCSSLFNYASTLEDENARLNKQISQCREVMRNDAIPRR